MISMGYLINRGVFVGVLGKKGYIWYLAKKKTLLKIKADI